MFWLLRDSGYCAMWMKSPCYRCQTEVVPTCIVPPKKKGEQRTRNTHECAAPDCVGHTRHHSVMAAHVGRRPHYIRGTHTHTGTPYAAFTPGHMSPETCIPDEQLVSGYICRRTFNVITHLCHGRLVSLCIQQQTVLSPIQETC